MWKIWILFHVDGQIQFVVYGELGKEVSEATMKFALLKAGVAVVVLEGMSSRDLQSLYKSWIKKSKISKTKPGLQKTHKKITYCTWESRARRSAKTPNSASQYYKMSKEELMSLLEPFDLDKRCLNNTALAKLCVLYHSEISGEYLWSFFFHSFFLNFFWVIRLWTSLTPIAHVSRKLWNIKTQTNNPNLGLCGHQSKLRMLPLTTIIPVNRNTSLQAPDLIVPVQHRTQAKGKKIYQINSLISTLSKEGLLALIGLRDMDSSMMILALEMQV